MMNEYPEHTIDRDGYPTEEFLKWIEEYDTVENSPFEFIQLVLDDWWGGCMGWKIQRKYRGERKVFISTLGWSGNEDMIYALQRNNLFWIQCYFSHQTGGHYCFRFTR